MNPKFPSGRRVLEKGESSCRGSDVNQTIDSRFEPSRPHMGVEISARDNGGRPPAHPLVDNRVTLLLDRQADAQAYKLVEHTLWSCRSTDPLATLRCDPGSVRSRLQILGTRVVWFLTSVKLTAVPSSTRHIFPTGHPKDTPP